MALTRNPERSVDDRSLTRSRSVLDHNGFGTENDVEVAYFVSGGTRYVLHMPTATYEDLGKPSSITIAIWPDDRQDLMEAEEFPS